MEERGAGVYRFDLWPDATGEHPVLVRFGDLAIRRTPLVLPAVHEDWGNRRRFVGW